MSLTKEDKIAIRIMYLKDLNEIFSGADKLIKEKVENLLNEAEADEIELTNPDAADVHRRLKTRF
ncbi:MAG TPA: hypothetical protein PKY59_12685 [Pyrinomonadaceae bacterium]|nr:hypothetical protein [Pyrinomonadaceae bacterium]